MIRPPPRSAPGPGYPTPRQLFAECVEQMRRPDAIDLWCTLACGEAVIQINAATVNTCLEPVDLAAIAQDLGIPDATGRVRPRMSGVFRKKPDLTLHDVSALTPDEAAALIDAAFAVGYGLGAEYAVTAVIED